MAPEEAPQAPRRRGRPPGSKNKTTQTRRKRATGGDLVGQLNAMVAELIAENRKLRRQVVKLTERAAGPATKTVERGLRTISRRVQRALGGGTKGRKRATPATNGRRRKTTATRRRRASS
ncbi:MAG TPA: hypothetical protein VEU76_02945 [Candidatus Udaeobacter sp.]|nr:hypothetical protein [Candidatus Udaeobacter sp.]